MCGKPASRVTRSRTLGEPAAGGGVLDPDGAERHSQRTQQQRKAAPCTGRHRAPTPSVARRRPGCSQRGNRDFSGGRSYRRSYLTWLGP